MNNEIALKQLVQEKYTVIAGQMLHLLSITIFPTRPALPAPKLKSKQYLFGSGMR